MRSRAGPAQGGAAERGEQSDAQHAHVVPDGTTYEMQRLRIAYFFVARQGIQEVGRFQYAKAGCA
jgi:hypothetical protein